MKLNYSGLIDTVRKHSPEVLTGIGIAGMIFTTIHAVVRTPEALRKIEEKKEELGKDKLTFKETVQAVWKVYIWDAAACAASTTCLVCATSEGMRHNAALSAAYVLSESKVEEFREKTKELVGEEKMQEIEQAVAEEQVRRDPPDKKEVVMIGSGDVLCYDGFAGGYFRSNANALQKAANTINRQMLVENYVSLNDFYYEIGHECTKVGEDFGWNINDGLIELYFTSILTDDGVPCLVVNYEVKPKSNYSR